MAKKKPQIADIQSWRKEKKAEKQQWKVDMEYKEAQGSKVSKKKPWQADGQKQHKQVLPKTVESVKTTNSKKKQKAVVDSETPGSTKEPEAAAAPSKRSLKAAERALGKRDQPENEEAAEDPSAEVEAEAPKKKKHKKEEGDAVEDAVDAVVVVDPEAFKVVVAGIPFHVNEKTLRRDFKDCGEILSLRLLMDRETGKSRGIAFISFTEQAAVDKALDFNGEDYAGRSLFVQIAGGALGASGGKSKGKGTGQRKSSGPGEKPAGLGPDCCTSVVLKGLAFSVTDAELLVHQPSS
ncbi:unnamed protein product [Polarella glacialis]|uniref:RRM domain-containing protein n=1 Tax=Polarella glacialis TaxID=89957 RepID=A0A813HZK0_POLGL|nr:unnamed protein product [Polarella glacialis]